VEIVEDQLVAQRPGALRVEYVEPFVSGMVAVLRQEAKLIATRASLQIAETAYTTREVTVMIGVTGDIRGLVMYGLSKTTAIGIASRMLDEPVTDLHDMAQSALAEMGNMVTGQAAIALAQRGITANICPPGLLLGSGVVISTFEGRHRLVVPFDTELGQVTADLAIEQAT
jgi:chemotaxis protein CheX